MFSKRSGNFGGIPNRLYRRRDALIRSGSPITDLISANVHQHGIAYPKAILKRVTKEAVTAATIYRPDPQGQRVARLAIQKYYETEGIFLPADQIILTPGASISYQYLFQLFANPGDEILCPSPSYPLFEAIAALSDVKIRYYPLVLSSGHLHNRWEISFDDFESRIHAKTRAIVLISPHNPTGAVITTAEMEKICDIARRFSLPIIFDEVFSAFLFNTKTLPRPQPSIAPLIILINGLSKMLALPGVKIGWMGILGDSDRVKKSVRILQKISDTFLPNNEWAQFATPTLFAEGGNFLKQYKAQMEHRKEIAMSVLSHTESLAVNPPEAGFYVVVKIKDPRKNEEKIALALLEQEGILIHPGYFYNLPPGHLVICFVSRPQVLRKCLEKIVRHCTC
ncbi:MAG: aminotransferase class I/II-fold pyridoxal phosphate-dependent enzyme [Nitrospirota bacterium]